MTTRIFGSLLSVNKGLTYKWCMWVVAGREGGGGLSGKVCGKGSPDELPGKCPGKRFVVERSRYLSQKVVKI